MFDTILIELWYHNFSSILRIIITTFAINSFISTNKFICSSYSFSQVIITNFTHCLYFISLYQTFSFVKKSVTQLIRCWKQFHRHNVIMYRLACKLYIVNIFIFFFFLHKTWTNFILIWLYTCDETELKILLQYSICKQIMRFYDENILHFLCHSLWTLSRNKSRFFFSFDTTIKPFMHDCISVIRGN